ncbi:MAG: efflux RND transporter periplasmic adaptor subunit [Cyanobacteria bacterium]|nr:efflux RND transporter periplasmic adaptor subunit [Cyanobacteriota bacterium]
MNKKTFAIVAIIVVVGIVVAAAILRSPAAGSGEHEEAPGPLDYPRGPHGARLLSDEGLQLEMTIYESGVPPQFRIYPYDGTGKAMTPDSVQLIVELHRLGGRVDRITFTPEADYLRGNQVVEEPHSFDVKIQAALAGRKYAFEYAQIEGKVQMLPEQIKSAGMTIGVVGPREMTTVLELPGEVKADETRIARVVPRLQGVVEQVLKKQGDQVGRGELIAVINSRELADAKRDYIEAAHTAAYRADVLQREEMLFKKKISAEQELRLAEKLVVEARLAEKLAGQKLVVLGVPSSVLAGLADAPAESMARYEIRSPLDGVILERNVTVGEAVTADAAIFSVGDLSAVWVDIAVYAKDLGNVRTGQEATIVSTDLGREATGRISFLGPLVGQATRSAIARIVLPNSGQLWRPGLFVTVRLVRESIKIPLAVAAEAIQTFRDWQVVFVKYGDWFEARPLELGRTDGQWVEVLSGLKAGDQYALANSFAVKAEIGKLGATHDH